MRLQGKTIGYFLAEGVEDLEFWVPLMRLQEEGARVIVIGLNTHTVRGKHGLEMTPDISIDEAPGANDLDGLVIPGGWAPINCGVTSACCNSCAIWMRSTKSSPPSVTAAGFPSRQASCAGAKPLARLASRMTSPTLAASGSTNQHSAKATWYGAASSRIFQPSVGNW